MRALKWAGALLGGVLLLAAGAMAALMLALDAGALTPRLLATIEGATGRSATLGAVSVRPGLVPRLAVEGATLANIEGGSRPEMARIRRIEASVALLPLLRGEVAFDRIAVDGADILLERAADGRVNWTFAPQRRPAAATAAPAASATAPAARRAVSVAEIVLTDSRITLPDARLGTIAILRLTATGVGAGGPVGLDARLALHGTPFVVEATSGPVPPPPGVPWPLRARLASGANSLSAEGAAGGPFAITATLPEPAALLPLLAALAPDAPMPPMLPPAEASLILDADLAPRDMNLRFGPADLGALAPGLLLTRLEASLPHLAAPAEATAEGSHAGLPFRVALRLDAPAALLPGAADQALAIAADLAAGGATASLAGRIARPRSLEGAAFEVHLSAPDLGALAAVLPDAPPLRDVTATARLAAPGRLDGSWRIAPFSIASTPLQAEGDVTIRPGRPVGLDGRVAAARIDLDALGEALARRQAAQPRPAAPAPTPRAAPPAAPSPQEARVIPDIPLPLTLARVFRGRLDLAADHLIVGGTDWRGMRGRLALTNGSAHLTDFAAVTPGGPVRGEATLDAATTPPGLALALRSEGAGLDLAALRQARQEAAGIEGRAQVRIEMRGRGATTRAVAATLTGEAGLALADGRLAQAGLLRLGPDLLGLLMPGAPQDGLELRCFAVRLSAEDGMARTSALLAETSAGRVEGVAAVNLATEGLAARLMPDVTLFGVRVRTPVGIGGTLASPRVGVEPGRALTQVIGDTVANRLWRDPTVEWLRGRAGGATPAGDCATQLRIARFGADGPVPAAPRIVPGVPRELQGTAQDVLRGLGGLLGGGGRR